MPNIGTPELILILIVVLVLLGVGKIPQIARGLGTVVREIRKREEDERDVPPKRPAPRLPAEGWLSRLERALGEAAETMDEGLTLAAMLSTLLEVYNVSPYRLAEETGVDRSTIGRWLSGKTKTLQKESLDKLMRAFPALSPRRQEELRIAAGHPPVEAMAPLANPLQVYLSCHGEDISAERQAMTAALSSSLLLFGVEVGDETWPPEEAAAEVRHSDYLVMVQGRRWVPLRRAEHKAAQESKRVTDSDSEKQQVTGLYFQKQSPLPLQLEVEQFKEEVEADGGKWTQFADADALAQQVWTGLWETMTREAREGRGRGSLQSMALIYLTTRLIAGEETTLPALFQRLAVGESEGVSIEKTGTLEVGAEETGAKKDAPRRWGPRRPLEPKLVHVPAGRFWMGTNRSDLEWAGVKWENWMERETPRHQVYLPDYAIGKYPVTNSEFAHFIEDGGYTNLGYWTDAGWRQKESEGWTQPLCWEDTKFNAHSQPVVGVSWYEAVAYCNWLAAKTGRDYRLPSEAEWEKAARGTDGRIYPWGNEHPDESRCNFAYKARRTTPVGQYSSKGDSPYGCADMAGNVWEWTRSLWGKDWTKPEFGYPYDRRDGREDLSAGVGVRRVLRGGAFFDFQWVVRCAFRLHFYPYLRYRNYGFRVVVASPVHL